MQLIFPQRNRKFEDFYYNQQLLTTLTSYIPLDIITYASLWLKRLKYDLKKKIAIVKKKMNNWCTDPDKYESIFWARLQGEWNKISSLNNLVDAHPWLPEYEKIYDPFNEYKFNTENPMRNMNNALEEGKRRLEAGDLPSAVLCFEAAVQEDPKNAEAWLILGKTQAENEQDPMAICALKNCLQIDPTNLVALMTLAISYTNESYQNQACITLKEWLSKHEKYKHLVDNSNDSRRRSKSDVSTILFKFVLFYCRVFTLK